MERKCIDDCCQKLFDVRMCRFDDPGAQSAADDGPECFADESAVVCAICAADVGAERCALGGTVCAANIVADIVANIPADGCSDVLADGGADLISDHGPNVSAELVADGNSVDVSVWLAEYDTKFVPECNAIDVSE